MFTYRPYPATATWLLELDELKFEEDELFFWSGVRGVLFTWGSWEFWEFWELARGFLFGFWVEIREFDWVGRRCGIGTPAEQERIRTFE